MGTCAGRTTPRLLLGLGASCVAALAGCARWTATPSPARPAPLFDGLGSYRMPDVTVAAGDARRYFDQGLVLLYGFNHAEAERSFRAAAALDPRCAMCWWGAAYVVGPNINLPMQEEAIPRAWEALQKALAAAPGVTARERAYIEALSKRYAEDPPGDRKPLDVAYADAMRELARRYPADLDARTLFAESLLTLRPWDRYARDGSPNPGTEEAVATLESVLASDPEHPGAIHYYIHATEGSREPGRAERFADRRAELAPGAGHLVHMPGHTYFRIGRYHDCVETNARAEEADNRYVAQCHAQGVYPLAYVPHNPHFGWACAAMAGESESAFRMAALTVKHTDPSKMREPGLATLQHYSVIPLWAKTRFGRWKEILAEPAPPEDLKYPTGVWRYARGLALARTGRPDEAERELAALRALVVDDEVEKVTIWDINSASQLLAIGARALAGEIAAARADYETAIAELREGVRLEDELRYNEPPDWHFPVRHMLGAVLLEAGRAAEAEAVYRADLSIYPDSGWSLAGLARSLEAQGKTEEAAGVRARFERAWAHADVEIVSSRL